MRGQLLSQATGCPNVLTSAPPLPLPKGLRQRPRSPFHMILPIAYDEDIAVLNPPPFNIMPLILFWCVIAF